MEAHKAATRELAAPMGYPPTRPHPDEAMQQLLLTVLLSAGPVPAECVPAFPSTAETQDRTAEFEKRYEAAKEDTDALWELHRWTETYGLGREGRKVLRQLVKLDPDDTRAHELLGHVKVDGRWFTSQKKADAYLAEREEEEARAKGWVRYEGRWVDPRDVPFLELGLVRDPRGRWVDPAVLRRLEEGWVQQDLTWISPEEQHNLEAGLWKVGDDWTTLEEADRRHDGIGAWWQIPGNRFVIWSTNPRSHSDRVLRELDATYSDLTRFYGLEPTTPPHVIVLRNLDQYSAFATGSDERQAGDLSGLSGLHGAFLADGWYGEDGGFLGTGAAYWDPTSEATDRFGRHFVRHAAGLAFAEAIDLSPEFEAKVKRSRRTLERDLDKFYEEKRIPPVLRFGAASYVERFFVDRSIARGGDADWPSKWAWQNIESKGGLSSLEQILRFRLQYGDEGTNSASQNLLAQAGLLVSFILSGTVPEVTEAHRAWQVALAGGGRMTKPTGALFDVLLEHEAAFRAFAKSISG